LALIRSCLCLSAPLSLSLSLCQLLITKAMKSPHDPYLELDDTFWPPFLEALLRYGVVLRHPDDPHRIRLEEFNQ
ncbi:hypothetical protein chiPu_0026996, partial [Chiloscyllium punctatum]|nr:hypothetical protein [Chiloscyllium punctatum]